MARAQITTKHSYDGSEFERGMTRAKQEVNAFASGRIREIGGMIAGAFTVSRLIDYTRQAAEAAHETENMARAMNMSFESYQTLMVLADRSGAGHERMTQALNKLQIAQNEAISKSGAARQAFQALGVSVEQLRQMTTEDVVSTLAKRLRDSSNDANVLAAAADLLGGRAASFLLPALKELGADGFDSLNKKMLESNQIMSELAGSTAAAMAEASERLGKSLRNMWTKWTGEFYVGLRGIRELWRHWLSGESEGKGVLRLMDLAAEFTKKPPQAMPPSEGADQTSEAELRRQAKRDYDLLKLEDEMNRLAASKRDLTVAAQQPEAANQFARLGLFMGGANNPLMTMQQQANEHLKKIADLNQRIADIEQRQYESLVYGQ